MKKTLTALALALAALAASAQEPALTEHEETISVVPVQTHYTETRFDGFRFDLPEGCVADTAKDSFIAKYPDGSFGVSMTLTDAKASDQKRATAVVQGLARSMHLPSSAVRQTVVNGMKGAVATGDIEGKRITVAVLTHNGHELQVVAMADPSHLPWTDQLMKSLRH